MSVLVPIALISWVVVSTALFTIVAPRRAALVVFLIGWLFLPQASLDMPGLPDLDKVSATSLGAILGIMLFDAGRIARLQLSWVDLPVIIWVVACLPAALLNEAPPDGSAAWYDGMSGMLGDMLFWAVPYFVGRLYFNDLASLRELAIGIFAGGLIYAPFCAWEIRMSPQLHNMIYGFHPSSFAEAIRFGGYRPMMFMQHGLMVGMWMTTATLVGWWLWSTGSLRKFMNVPMAPLVGGMFVITVLCKSLGAIALLLVGVMLLATNRVSRSTGLLVAVMMLTPAYMVARTAGWWSGGSVVELAAMIDEERASSLEGRLETEDLLFAKAAERPWFGWGGWGRWRVRDPKTGEDITKSDGMWVIARGEKGLIGLASITAMVLLPFALVLRRIPARHWSAGWYAAPAALAVLLLLYSIDNLLNAMVNPIFMIAAGGLSGLYLAMRRPALAPAHAMQSWPHVHPAHRAARRPALQPLR